MSIADQITRIKNAKAAIKEAIQNKGVAVSDEAKIDEYPALIDSISGEGGSVDAGYWPKFFELRTKNYTTLQYVFGWILVLEEDEATKSLIENFDVSNATDTKYAFYGFGGYNNKNQMQELDLTKWNVNKVKDFGNTFSLCYTPHINISGWDFSKTSSLYSFCTNSDVNTIDMSNCNTSTITNFSYFFQNCSKLTSIDMTGCDTSKSTNMNNMFYNNKSIAEIT